MSEFGGRLTSAFELARAEPGSPHDWKGEGRDEEGA